MDAALERVAVSFVILRWCLSHCPPQLLLGNTDQRSGALSSLGFICRQLLPPVWTQECWFCWGGPSKLSTYGSNTEKHPMVLSPYIIYSYMLWGHHLHLPGQGRSIASPFFLNHSCLYSLCSQYSAHIPWKTEDSSMTWCGWRRSWRGTEGCVNNTLVFLQLLPGKSSG